MKKIFIINLLLCSLFITGCGCNKKKELKEAICTKTVIFDTHDYDVKYVMSYDSKNRLIYYNRHEEFKSFDINLLSNTLEYKNMLYADLVALKGYDFSGYVENDKLITEMNVDFKNISAEKLFELEPSYQNYYDEDKRQFDIDKTIYDFERNDFECMK